ncbi:MAG: restriction endonuclease subunit R [Cyanobacteriota bacterium]|nr:restriction endonuclease subunit R [Cyanobacteriota bacterium]
MVATLKASEISFPELETIFYLDEVDDDQFFREWQDDLPEITDAEKQILDKIKAGYFNLLRHPPMLENAVKMAVVSPLLLLADFFLPPFQFQAEKSVQLVSEDDGTIIEGRIDILVLQNEFWVTVIESKQAGYSVEVGIPQLLAYMLANPNPSQPCYGMISNGGYFLFLKLVCGKRPKYATSELFYLRKKNGNDLYRVVSILKRLGQLAKEIS